jgi:hypothetical protein
MPDQNPTAAGAAAVPDLASHIEAVLRTRLPALLGGMVRRINIAQILAASGNLGDIEVDKIVLGSAHIDQLIVQGTTLDLHSGSAFLQNVRTILDLNLSLDWSVSIGFASASGTINLGTLSFGINLGNILVPTLNNIPISIPQISASNVTADIAPISNIDLGGGTFTAVNATIPANGFQLTGLGLGSLSLSTLQVPQTTVDKVSIQDVSPNRNIVVPSVQLNQLQLPAAAAADIQTTAPIAFTAIASAQGVSASAGVISVSLWATPVIHISIGSLLLQNVSISGTVNRATIQNVSVPVDIRGVNLKTISIGQIDVNNITL